MDLKVDLGEASGDEKLKIQHAISKIEHADIQRAKIALKIQLGREPSAKEIADYLGWSTVSVHGFLLGKAYAQTVLKHTSEILTHIVSKESNKYGAHAAIVDKLKKIGTHNDLEKMAKQFKTTREEMAEMITSLWMLAQVIEGDRRDALKKFEKDMDEEVAKTLGIDTLEIDQWVHRYHILKSD